MTATDAVVTHETVILRPSALERAAKLLVVASVAAAMAYELRLASGVVKLLPVYGAVAFIAAFVLIRVAPRAAQIPLFVTCYVTPALLSLAFRNYIAPYYAIWLAAFLGIMVGTRGWTEWHVPPAVRLPLALWALTLAAVWPIIVAREYNFTWDWWGWHTNNSLGGIPPGFAALGICHAAATQLVALLAIDWSYGKYHDIGPRRFARDVILWLAVSAAISGVVAIYQATVDIQFLNGGVFPTVGRASGTLADANPYGILAALWGIAAVALLLALRGDAGVWATVAILAVSWCAFWPSGSRNALIAGVAGLFVVAWAQWSGWTRRSKTALACLVLTAAVGVGIFAATTRGAVTSPMARFRQLINRPSEPGASSSLIARMWDPYGYAAVTKRMIKDAPLVGVGLGTYSFLVIDYSRSMGQETIAFDNAQNWFRHQFAELGVLGSIGWFAWAVVFAVLIVFARARSPRDRVVTRMVRFLPVLFALVSLVGMPTMNSAAAITFALFAAWYLLLIDTSVLERALGFKSTRAAWIAIGLFVALFSTATVISARSDLRVPNRATRFGWPYEYGFYERPQGVPDSPQRTAQHAMAVFPTNAPYLELTFWAEHPDVAVAPVDVRIWRGEALLPKASLVTHSPVTWYVRTPADRSWMMLRFETSRTWSTGSGPGAPTYGVTVASWKFVEHPPLRAAVIE